MALGALVVTSTVCSLDGREPAAAVAVSHQPAVTATSAAAQAPAPAPASATPTPLRAGGGCNFTVGGQPAARVGRCTVIEIGDSLGSDLGWGLARETPPTSGLTLVQLDKSSTGLAVPSFYDWPAKLSVALHRYRPQLVVICLGGNDQQGMEVNGKPLQFGTPAWRTAYLSRVHRLAQEATSAGVFVLWVGLPVMQQPTYDRGSQELDGDFAAGIAGLPRAGYLSTRSLLAGPGGAYASEAVLAGRKTGLREADGIHLSLDGENIAATYVLQQISARYGVNIAPTAPAVIQAQR